MRLSGIMPRNRESAMLIKSADDKSKRLLLLEELQKSDRLDERQKTWLREQFWRMKPGLKGEKDAAHYLDLSFSFSKNHAVLHDLRLEHDGKIAQIDHLVVDRMLTFYLLETKNYSGSLHINEYGEFSVEYSGQKLYGIESPIEQSRRHEIVLKGVLERVGITGRLGTAPTFVHVVLIHPKGQISRPAQKAFDTANVIKADNFAAWHKTYIDKLGPVESLPSMLNFRGRGTVKEWGDLLKGEHQRENPFNLPEFMKPKLSPAPVKPAEKAKMPEKVVTTLNKPAVCATCSKRLSDAVATFCRANPERFGRKLYCIPHQKAFS
jgi:hypothetical protein